MPLQTRSCQLCYCFPHNVIPDSKEEKWLRALCLTLQPTVSKPIKKKGFTVNWIRVLFILSHISFYNTFYFLSSFVINYPFLCLLKHPSVSLPIHLPIHLTCRSSAICLVNFTSLLYCIFVQRTHGVWSIPSNAEIKIDVWFQISFKMTSLM